MTSPAELQAKLPSDLAQHITFEGCDYVLMSPEDYDAQADEVRALRKLLVEAVDDIEDWASYASAYFQDKHDLSGTLARYRAALRSQP